MLEAIQERVQFFKLFESLQIDFLTIFLYFTSQMGPKMDPKINQKSIPRPPGLSEGPPDGPRTLRDSILEWFLMIFKRFWKNSGMISIKNLARFLNNFDMRLESQT